MRPKKLPPVKPIKASDLLAKKPQTIRQLMERINSTPRPRKAPQPTPPEPNTEAIKLAQIRALARQLNLA
jgi:hypothetical protein